MDDSVSATPDRTIGWSITVIALSALAAVPLWVAFLFAIWLPGGVLLWALVPLGLAVAAELVMRRSTTTTGLWLAIVALVSALSLWAIPVVTQLQFSAAYR